MILAHSDSPLNVTLLLFPGLSLLSLAATLDPMRGANRVLGRPAYCWKLVSIDGKMPPALHRGRPWLAVERRHAAPVMPNPGSAGAQRLAGNGGVAHIWDLTQTIPC
jgi:transcriptional regulator GlxA family with amidase domain